MPIKCFDLFLKLSSNWNTKEFDGMHTQLKYIEKCISKDPIKCYRFIRDNDYWKLPEAHDLIDEKTKLLLKIYKKLECEEDKESMNEIMDLFDELLLTNSREINKALEEMNE